MSFRQPFNYDPQRGVWNLELYKAEKDTYSQAGVKITLDPGFPTGEKGACYQTKEPAGLHGASLEIRCFDNLSGWTSAVNFPLSVFLEKLIEMMPKNTVKHDTFVLGEKDAQIMNIVEKQQIINSFWYGSELGDLENMCIKSFIKSGFQFHLWSYDMNIKVPTGCIVKDANEILPKENIFIYYKNNSIAPFSDWFRFKLLYDKGGRWTDMDVVCLQPFDFPLNSICGEEENSISIGMISLEKGHPMAKLVIEAYDNPSKICDYDDEDRLAVKKELQKMTIEEQRVKAPWGFLGNELLKKIYKNFDFNVIPTKDFYPIPCVFAGGIYNNQLNMGHVFGAKCVHMFGEIYRHVVIKDPSKMTENSIFSTFNSFYNKND